MNKVGRPQEGKTKIKEELKNKEVAIKQLSLFPQDDEADDASRRKGRKPQAELLCPRCRKKFERNLMQQYGSIKLCPDCLKEKMEIRVAKEAEKIAKKTAKEAEKKVDKAKKATNTKIKTKIKEPINEIKNIENPESQKVVIKKPVNKVKDKIYRMLNCDSNDAGYVISIVYSQIKKNIWEEENVLAALNYITENNLDAGINVSNFFFAIQKYYGAGTRELIQEQIALASVPDNIEEILNKEVKVIEKKRSDWIRDNQVSEERRKYRAYGPKIDLNDIIEGE